MDIVDAYQKNMDACRTKMKNFKQHAIKKEIHLHYALGAIAILVIIIFSMYICALDALPHAKNVAACNAWIWGEKYKVDNCRGEHLEAVRSLSADASMDSLGANFGHSSWRRS